MEDATAKATGLHTEGTAFMAEGHLKAATGGLNTMYPVNISETETGYSIAVYATSFDKENIKLSVVEDVLFISGTRQVDESSLPNFIKQEFP